MCVRLQEFKSWYYLLSVHYMCAHSSICSITKTFLFMNASAYSTSKCALFIKANAIHISPRMRLPISTFSRRWQKSKNHKLNNFLMLLLEGKNDNHVMQSGKSGNITLLSIENIFRYVCMLMYKKFTTVRRQSV